MASIFRFLQKKSEQDAGTRRVFPRGPFGSSRLNLSTGPRDHPEEGKKCA